MLASKLTTEIIGNHSFYVCRALACESNSVTDRMLPRAGKLR